MAIKDNQKSERNVLTVAETALRKAQAKARASGSTIVVVEGRDVVRISPAGRTVIRTLKPRTRVRTNVKHRVTK